MGLVATLPCGAQKTSEDNIEKLNLSCRDTTYWSILNIY